MIELQPEFRRWVKALREATRVAILDESEKELADALSSRMALLDSILMAPDAEAAFESLRGHFGELQEPVAQAVAERIFDQLPRR